MFLAATAASVNAEVVVSNACEVLEQAALSSTTKYRQMYSKRHKTNQHCQVCEA